MLDSKRLLGALSSSVVNQRTRIINNFLRTCQESDTIKASRQWGEFLRGQKPGDPPGTPRTPTNRELREDLRYYLDSLGPAKILSEEEEGRKQVLEGRTEWGGVTKRKVTMGDEQP